MFENGTKIQCFDNDPDHLYGWCGVCDPEAVQGQAGFCDPMSHQVYLSEDDLKEATVTQHDKNWGWCSKSCLVRQINPEAAAATMLQVAFVNILAKRDCVG